MENNIGKYIILRCEHSGVFAGTLESMDGRTVRLTDCRCLWYWSGAASLLQLAKEGVKRPQKCKFTVTVNSVTLLDAIEIIPATTEAESNIKAVPEWRM